MRYYLQGWTEGSLSPGFRERFWICASKIPATRT